MIKAVPALKQIVLCELRINVVNCVGMVAVGGDIVEAEKRQPLFPRTDAVLKYRAFIGIGMTVNTAEGKKRHKGIGGVKHYNRYIVFYCRIKSARSGMC